MSIIKVFLKGSKLLDHTHLSTNGLNFSFVVKEEESKQAKERKGKERKDMTRKKQNSTFCQRVNQSGSLETRLSWVYVKKIKIVLTWHGFDMKAKMNRRTLYQ